MNIPDSTAFLAATHWLVCDGRIILEPLSSVAFVTQALLGLAACGALIGALQRIQSTRHFDLRLPVALAGGAALVGIFGYFDFLSFWPRLAYCRTDGERVGGFLLNNFFAVPWLFGVVGLMLGATSFVTVVCPNCRQKAIPFRAVWLMTPWSTCACPGCAAQCRLKTPQWWLAIDTLLGVSVLALGFLLGGGTGFALAATCFLPFDAWMDLVIIRKFGFLQPIGQSKTNSSP